MTKDKLENQLCINAICVIVFIHYMCPIYIFMYQAIRMGASKELCFSLKQKDYFGLYTVPRSFVAYTVMKMKPLRISAYSIVLPYLAFAVQLDDDVHIWKRELLTIATMSMDHKLSMYSTNIPYSICPILVSN